MIIVCVSDRFLQVGWLAQAVARDYISVPKFVVRLTEMTCVCVVVVSREYRGRRVKYMFFCVGMNGPSYETD